MKVSACLGLLASVALFAPAAHAQEELLHLQFQGATGCPGAADFIAQVRTRTERVRFVDTTNSALELEVHADVERDRAVGRIRLGSENADRLVTGKTCVDVISALALIAALAVDPTASSGSGVDGVAREATEPLARAETAGEDAAPAGSADAGRNAPGVPNRSLGPRDASDVGPTPRVARASATEWFGGMGAQAEVSTGFGVGAITLAGASVHGEMGVATDSIWRPALRLSAVLAQSPTVVPEGQPETGAAKFTLIAGRAAACPLEFRPRANFLVRPCATLEVGRLEGQAKPVDNGSITALRSGQMTRVAAGQAVQARLRVASRLWLELGVAAVEPLVRQKFVFLRPDVTVSSVPVVELAMALGLGVYFP